MMSDGSTETPKSLEATDATAVRLSSADPLAIVADVPMH